MKMSNRLRQRLVLALIAILIALATTVTATFAWYIYQTSAHTTNIKMAVGTGATLLISNEVDGTYRSSTVLESFPGFLNPVSTNRLEGGFQKVFGFTSGNENRPYLLANLFGASDENIDYYKTSLYIKGTGDERTVYLADIQFEDKDEAIPLSSAIRVGFVVHEPVVNPDTKATTIVKKEFFFEITDKQNPERQYNTYSGEPGCVLDCEKDDGTTVMLEQLYGPANFSEKNTVTGEYEIDKNKNVAMFQVKGKDGNPSEPGTPVQVDVYVWLEGCDEDCTSNLMATSMKNLALAFACDTSQQ